MRGMFRVGEKGEIRRVRERGVGEVDEVEFVFEGGVGDDVRNEGDRGMEGFVREVERKGMDGVGERSGDELFGGLDDGRDKGDWVVEGRDGVRIEGGGFVGDEKVRKGVREGVRSIEVNGVLVMMLVEEGKEEMGWVVVRDGEVIGRGVEGLV